MPGHRPFRFAAQIGDAPDGGSWQDQARKVEDLGFSSLLMPDHFDRQLAPVPALAAAAEATTNLRIGGLVLDNDYRHPVVLAKEMATLDVLSGGRLELGLGAGWMRSDYDQSGIGYDSPGVRIDRFLEGLAVIRGCFAGEPFSFSGEHYTITDHTGYPTPAQPGGPPIMIGAGAPRMLGIAAREADIVNVNFDMAAGEVGPDSLATGTGDATRAKIDRVRGAAGDRLDDIELSVTAYFASVTDDADSLMEMVASGFGVDVAGGYDLPHILIGSVDQICETLEQRREELGFSYIVFAPGAWEKMAPVVAKLAGS
jgi:probable F420-dependent oxidoreductase